jgi:preprotein translocase subunit SecD
MTYLRWRVGAALAVVLWFGFLSVANLVPEETRRASPLLPDEGLRLGLDLQGGIHWVLGVKLDVAEAQELEYLRQNLVERDEEDDDFAVGEARAENGQLVVTVAGATDAAAVREWASDTNSLATVSDQETSLSFRLNPAAVEAVRQRGMEQVLEVLRRRIEDPVRGIPDSVVTRQGVGRVLVQIPGGQIDRSRARELLKVTGFLEFKIVKDSAPTEELLRARHADGLPAGSEIGFEREKETNRVLTAYLLDEKPAITGDHLVDARVNFDRQNRPLVEFRFDTPGAKIFGDLTEANIGNNLAIVLDDLVYSAPVIRSRIGAQGQIEGRFSAQEAADLAVVLRSGSLPIPVTIEEERTIGPRLGADSIRHGIQASVASLIAVLVFAVVYYRVSGVYATIAISTGMLMIVGLMAMFRATLTMPGIAGLVLTVGMAIDGNVLIFERIREELRHGKTPRAAIRAGFSRALLPILDGNLTTLITAIVLYEYGTGPIKGFAVTLGLGLVATVFQAVVVNRLLFALYPGNRPVTTLSI